MKKIITKRRLVLAAGIAGAAIAVPSIAVAASAASPALSGSMTVYGQSSHYVSGQFEITNSSTQEKDWALSFDVPEGGFQNSSSWNVDATIDGDRVTLTPKNGALAAGQSLHISFGVDGDGTADLGLEGCALNGADVAGCSSAEGGEEDTEAPTVPTDLTADAVDESTAHVMWNHSQDNVKVAGYKVFQDGVEVKDVAGTTRMLNIGDLAASTTYEFEVQAYDAAGNHSPRTAAASVTMPGAPVEDDVAPTMVTELTATPTGPRTVDVTWEAATDNVGVVAYEISDGKGGITTVKGDATSATVTGLAPDTTYAFFVSAKDAAGNKGGGTIIEVVTPEDEPVEPGTGVPANFAAAAASYMDGDERMLQLALSWTPTTAAQRYEIHVNGAYVQTLLIGGNTTAEQKRNLLLGTTPGEYKVKIRVQLADGSWSDFTPERTVNH